MVGGDPKLDAGRLALKFSKHHAVETLLGVVPRARVRTPTGLGSRHQPPQGLGG